MIILVNVDIKELIDKERFYPWKKLSCCPKCEGKVWGHGFVQRWLDVSDSPLFLKRFFCTCCGSIMCLRPNTHFKGFYYSIKQIYSSLKKRLLANSDLPNIYNSIQYIWMRAFKQRIIRANLSTPFSTVQLSLFEVLVKKDIIPISRSNKLKSDTIYYQPT